MKKNVFFLCYSRYVIFVAYILKETVYKNDNVSLIIPDSTANYDGLVEQMERSKCWDAVIPFKELDDVENVKQRVIDFIYQNKIDVFCVAHILRSASHFFTEYLFDGTEINMFDEGCITLDFLGEYNNYCRHGLDKGWTEFHFERINSIYSFFPTITKTFYNAIVKEIHLEKLLNSDFIHKLSDMYGYTYHKQDIEMIFIDSNEAICGFYSQKYEQFCIDNILGNIDCTKCYIKRKPSQKEQDIFSKYGKYKINYISGGMVPFEIVYLNMVLNEDVPQLIVSTNSAAVWNIGYLNMLLKKKVDIVVLIDIMKDYYWDILFKEQVQNTLKKYNSFFADEYKILVPKTWEQLYQIMEKYLFFVKPDLDEIRDKELECLKKDYIEKCSREIHFYKPRFKEAYNWIMYIAKGNGIEKRLLEMDITKIAVYGIGDFAKMFISNINRAQIRIECFIVTKAMEKTEYEGVPVLSVDEFMKDKKVNKLPIIVSAVGREKEIRDFLKQNDYAGETFTFADLLRE